MPMNTASRGLSVHSKRPHLSGNVSTGNALSFFVFRIEPRDDSPSIEDLPALGDIAPREDVRGKCHHSACLSG